RLPHRFDIITLETLDDAFRAIREMWVRGAPLIGATAAYGVCLAMREDPSDTALEKARDRLLASRPTAINLRWALDRLQSALADLPPDQREAAAWRLADEIRAEDIAANEAIGENGLPLIREIWKRTGRTVNVLTHCNAGWLATVDWGTALAPIYKAQAAGIPLHVWVDETRPRNQGAALTAWELQQQGIAHQVICDNAGGHLMQQGKVDLCIVGSDRATASGDVCNKIGTYLKALAAADNGIPFYVALPGSTIDWSLHDGFDIPIENRDAREVTHMRGIASSGQPEEIRITPEGSPALNPAFDVTPAKLVTALITERGVCKADCESIARLFHSP
ncbi:MAG TPA: S-methyl-5-thioribose-1-phosphate isomerase, partial [Gammaproteobacteria bacterium]|nr:S-methyl-5-thioribose-1-phosphate isomerase [Gammaproteobacteria bacterium]